MPLIWIPIRVLVGASLVDCDLKLAKRVVFGCVAMSPLPRNYRLVIGVYQGRVIADV